MRNALFNNFVRWMGAMLVFGALGWVRSVRACEIPVFRYALERWEPYPYEILVFHEGPLPDDVRSSLEAMQEQPLNVSVWLTDVGQEDMHEELKKVWLAEKNGATLPWGVARYPYPFWNNVKTNTLWRGPFSAEAARLLTDSPARRAVAEHILKGASAVWVFVEGSDAAENDAKHKVLQERLDWVLSVAELPDLALEEASQGEMAEGQPGYVPLKIAFEIVRVRRDDPVERFFVDSLLNLEKDHEDFRDKPFAFPIFGQGRALWALIGDGIASATIDDACAFLLGPCSCTIKDLNPGVDMLVLADWYGGVSNLLSVSSEAPALVGLTLPDEGAPDDTDADAESGREIPVGLVAAVTLFALMLAAVLFGRKALGNREN